MMRGRKFETDVHSFSLVPLSQGWLLVFVLQICVLLPLLEGKRRNAEKLLVINVVMSYRESQIHFRLRKF